MDIKLVAHRHHRATHDACVPREPGNGEGEHGVEQSRAESRGDRDRQQQRRKGEEHVGDAHDDVVDAPAEVSGHQTDRDADQQRDKDDGNGDVERSARTVDHARENVATQRVGAEPVLGAGRLQLVAEVHPRRLVGGDPGREDGAEDDHAEEREPGHEQAVAARKIREPREASGWRQRNRGPCVHDALKRGSTT
jgi:hypothetical protein